MLLDHRLNTTISSTAVWAARIKPSWARLLLSSSHYCMLLDHRLNTTTCSTVHTACLAGRARPSCITQCSTPVVLKMAALLLPSGRAAVCQICRRYTTGRGGYVVAMARPFRPEMDDVDRLSKGGASKRRGTGSFHIPHRLNSDERPVYEASKKKGFLQVRGTGYRKGRKGHPLPNIYRQWCDAKGQPCIIIEQDASGSNRDVVVVDLAPLRSSSLLWAVERSLGLADAAGARRIEPAERPLHAVPFDTIPVDLPLSVEQFLAGSASGGEQDSFDPPPSPEQIAAAEGLVTQQADAVRQLKALGLANAHPEVQRHVQVLKKLKDDLQHLVNKAAAADGRATSNNGGSSSSSTIDAADAVDGSKRDVELSPAGQPVDQQQDGAHDSDNEEPAAVPGRQTLDSDHPFAKVAIWQLPVMPLFFEADRTAAKQLAKDLIEALKS